MTSRQTRQRDAIVRALEAAPGPVSVPDLLARAQAEQPGLGLATVYRALKKLQEDERVRAVSLDGESLFESAGRGHHHHFACRECRGVFDLDLCPVALPRGTVYPGGFVVETHEVTLYGLCPQCAAPRDSLT